MKSIGQKTPISTVSFSIRIINTVYSVITDIAKLPQILLVSSTSYDELNYTDIHISTLQWWLSGIMEFYKPIYCVDSESEVQFTPSRHNLIIFNLQSCKVTKTSKWFYRILQRICVSLKTGKTVIYIKNNILLLCRLCNSGSVLKWFSCFFAFFLFVFLRRPCLHEL